MWTFITDPDSTFWLVVDRVGILLGYIVLVTVSIAVTRWWRGVKRKERRIRHAQQLSRDAGARPVALSIATPGGAMEADIRRYLTSVLPGWDFPELAAGADDPGGARRCPIVEFEHEEGSLSPDGADADVERLREVVAWLKDEGFNEVHLFMRSTVAFGAAVGCLFANWGAVHVHHWNNTKGEYEYWFPLAEVKRAPEPHSALDDATAALARRLAERPAAPPAVATPHA
jgi:hypothetical protein